jgi:hypothetical protein
MEQAAAASEAVVTMKMTARDIRAVIPVPANGETASLA